jgi:hypothetical protein
MGGFVPPQQNRQQDRQQGSDPFFSTMAKRGMNRRRPQRMGGQAPVKQPPQMPPSGLPPVPQMPPPQPAGPPAGLPPTGGGFMAGPPPPQTGGPLMAPQTPATGSSADVNLGQGFDQMRQQQRRTAQSMYGPGGSPSFIR